MPTLSSTATPLRVVSSDWSHRREGNEAWMSRGKAWVNMNRPVFPRTTPPRIRIQEKELEKVQSFERGFHPPYTCFHLHPKKDCLPNRLCPPHAPARLPAPISTSNKKKNRSAKRKTRPPARER